MNPRQRRGLLLIAISALGLLGVFVLVAQYVADVREQVDPKDRIDVFTEVLENHIGRCAMIPLSSGASQTRRPPQSASPGSHPRQHQRYMKVD